MTERLCTYDDNDLDARGKPTPEYLKAYEEWGKGQIGVVVLVCRYVGGSKNAGV
jgi:hypothetical protein